MLPSTPALLADIAPNTTGLPGIATLSNIVGALLTIGLIACLAGLVIAVIVWAIGSHSSNPSLAGKGKGGVLIALVAAILIGGANILVDFFVATGRSL
jgi:hypothetical protein